MNSFRQLTIVALVCGVLVGFVQFAVQHVLVVPVIQAAEVYERAADAANAAAGIHGHEDEGWQPANGWERTAFTALASVLNGIACSSLLFGLASFAGKRLDIRSGPLWGIAAFICFSVAPSFGLPPAPPGAAVANLYDRQLWWIGTVVATAVGIWLLVSRDRAWWLRVVGVMILLVPHLIGAPTTSAPNVVPVHLMHKFAFVSLVTTAMFWVLLGLAGGVMYNRLQV